MSIENDQTVLQRHLADGRYEIIYAVIVLTVQEIAPPGQRSGGQAKVYQILANNPQERYVTPLQAGASSAIEAWMVFKLNRVW